MDGGPRGQCDWVACGVQLLALSCGVMGANIPNVPVAELAA